MRYQFGSAFHKTDPRTTMALKRTTAPTEPAVTLAEAKLHLRVDGSDEDALIAALVLAATEAAEQQTGRAIMPQKFTLSLDAFPAVVELTRVPATAVDSVKFDDLNGTEQPLAGSQYTFQNSDDYGFATIVPAFGKTWPSTQAKPDAVRIVYSAGYADATKVPESIKSWIKLMVGAMYANREAQAISTGSVVTLGYADRLLDAYRVHAL